MRKALTIATLLQVCTVAPAYGQAALAEVPHEPQQAAPDGLLALRQALLDATSDTRVVVVATHPDDPYRSLCLLLRRRWGCDVTLLLATRGEGGQNAIGPEQGEDLARIRTAETVRAASALDVRLRFLDFPDFGYSRSAAEALDVWRGDQAYGTLRDRVRELDPDFVVTIHGPRETHGQKHAIVDLLERLAADAAEKPYRIFRSVAEDETESPSVVIDYDFSDLTAIGGYRAESYRILEFHRTQAPHAPLDEAIPRRLALVDIGRMHGTSLFGELRTLWDEPAVLDSILEREGSSFDFVTLREAIDALPRSPELVRAAPSRQPVVRALECLAPLRLLAASAQLPIRLASRIERRVTALERAALIGSTLGIQSVHGDRSNTTSDGDCVVDMVTRHATASFEIHNGGPFDVLCKRVSLVDSRGSGLKVEPVSPRSITAGSRTVVDIGLSLEDDFVVPSAGVDAVLEFALELRDAGLARAVTIHATVARSIVPPPTVRMIALPEARFLVPENGGRVRLSLEVSKSCDRELVATLAMAGPPGVRFLPAGFAGDLPIKVEMERVSERRRIPIQLVVPAWTRLPSRPREVRFELRGQGVDGASCRIEIVPVRIRLPAGLRVGIVRGPDTTIEESLASLGVDVRALDPRDLARANLDDFDTIVIDSRALLRRREDLVPTIPQFLDYSRRGRHLVVLYHKPVEFSKAEIGTLLAPFPLDLGNERVTREDAPVEMLEPEHPLLSWPNRIDARDWDGWVQERGLYFPENYDTRYVELLSIRELTMGDDEPQPEAQRSSLLFAKAGRGSYVYCALVLHRQLRNLHPGAARLLVNLVTPPGWERLR
ncbi:MAG: PIG-L family deacetylase [Planctomycetes bacterium]|nr:PIG-L family deacetylase [Planctomycetota bacterium]MCB9916820.1 PIG-L family deacetylase [Planctomycetota bacterium]